MPNAPKTPHHQVRVERGLWDRFGAAVGRQDTDRSEAIRAFIRWYVSDEGAKMPKRPSAGSIEP
jgi:metal-responsive CopG/Arc/MetJ family transcriptional regulator